jgi:hypothetical protein
MLGAMTFRVRTHAPFLFALVVGLSACGGESTATPPPPPLPSAPAQPAAAAPNPAPEPPSAAEPRGEPESPAPVASPEIPKTKPQASDGAPSGASAGSEKGKTGVSLYDLAKRGEATLPVTPKPAPARAPTPKPPATSAPTPTPVAAKPTPAKPNTKVVVPSTDHVRVEVPKGLQAALDADPRMQPWVNQVIKVIDGCYAKERKSNPKAAGVIQVRITMHENSRPDADPKTPPSALFGVVTCATGGLMKSKMPLFTGKEGEKHTVNIRFES